MDKKLESRISKHRRKLNFNRGRKPPQNNNKMKVEAIKHTDVRGNELYYIKLTNVETKKELLINVGLKTYTAVSELQKEKDNQLKLEELEEKTNNKNNKKEEKLK